MTLSLHTVRTALMLINSDFEQMSPADAALSGPGRQLPPPPLTSVDVSVPSVSSVFDLDRRES